MMDQTIAACRRVTWVLLLLSLAMTNAVSAQSVQWKKNATPTNIKFRNIDHPNLVRLGQIWRITEDRQGFIWVAGAHGIARFDGLNVKLYQNDVSDPYSVPKGYVTDFYHARNGRIWVATYDGLYEFLPDRELFVKKSVWFESREALVVWDIAEDQQGNLWLGHSGGGIGKYDPQNDHYTRIVDDSLEIEKKDRQNNYAIIVDRNNRIWTGDELGLTRFDPVTGEFVRYRNDPQNAHSLIVGTIRSLIEDHQGQLWMGSSEGLARFDPSRETFYQYRNDPRDEHSLSGNNVGDITVDSQGQIWVAVDGAGLNLFRPEIDGFRQIKAKPNALGSIKNNSVRRVFTSKKGDLWLGYHPFGISVVDRYASVFETYTHDPLNENTLSSNTIHALYKSGEHDLWIGGEQGVNRIDLNTREVTRFQHVPGDQNSLSTNAVLTVLHDPSGRKLWAGTWNGGLNLYDFDTHQYTHFKHSETEPGSIPNNNVWIVKQRDNKSLWVGTSAGLSILDIATGQFSEVAGFHHRVGNLIEYGQNYLIVVDDNRVRILNTNTYEILGSTFGWDQLGRVANVSVGNSGELWFSTYDGLKRQKRLEAEIEDFYDVGEDMKKFYSLSITDRHDVLWLGNSTGITSFDPVTKNIAHFSAAHGLPGDSFRTARASVMLDDGRIAMGGAGGIAIFNPDEVVNFKTSIKPVLLGLNVLDERVMADTEGSPLAKVINRADKITLDYAQNVFSIEYSAIDFQLASLNVFRFRLIGFDPDWRSVGRQRVATYTNMDPGTYQFQVMAADDQGRWSNKFAAVDIHVLPPWWLTWWAYSLYVFLAFVLISAVVYGVWLNSQRLHEMQIVSKLKEIDRLKDEFMAKTSHELRTPLNGIIGLTETIVSGRLGPVSRPVQEKLQIVISSGKRLSNIINDILDFSRLRNHAIELNREPVALYELVQSVVQLSEPLLGSKKVVLTNAVDPAMATVFLDKQRITQVLFNLVGNAIKFTDQGNVSISATVTNGQLCVSVQDSGVGIRKEDQERIFQPFEQSLEDPLRTHFGTGLGLAVSKQLIEIHGGHIGLESQYGHGARFYFVIPLNSDTTVKTPQQNLVASRSSTHLRTRIHSAATDSSATTPRGGTAQAQELKDDGQVRKYRVLIVDDEPVNRLVLQGFLGDKDFDIVEAGSGWETIEIIENSEPFDIVLLDVMLPGMSGYEICEKIRQTFSLKALPILFLTAKSQVEDMEKGYHVGANDFLYKPVVREELLAKMKMQLQLYKALRG